MTTPLTEKEQTARRLSALANLLESRPNSHAMAENIALIREGAAAIEALAGNTPSAPEKAAPGPHVQASAPMAGSADVSREPAFELTDAERLLQAWADPLPPNGALYWQHVEKAREYFRRRGSAPQRVYPLMEYWSRFPTSAPETKKDDARDAERYRYLRERQAFDRLAARKRVPAPPEGGTEPYRTMREEELDREIDACIGSPEKAAVAPVGIMYESRSDTEFTDCVNCNQTPLSHAASLGRCPPKASAPCQPDRCEVQDYYDGLVQKSPTDHMREMQDHFDSLTPTVNGEIP